MKATKYARWARHELSSYSSRSSPPRCLPVWQCSTTQAKNTIERSNNSGRRMRHRLCSGHGNPCSANLVTATGLLPQQICQRAPRDPTPKSQVLPQTDSIVELLQCCASQLDPIPATSTDKMEIKTTERFECSLPLVTEPDSRCAKNQNNNTFIRNWRSS